MRRQRSSTDLPEAALPRPGVGGGGGGGVGVTPCLGQPTQVIVLYTSHTIMITTVLQLFEIQRFDAAPERY